MIAEKRNLCFSFLSPATHMLISSLLWCSYLFFFGSSHSQSDLLTFVVFPPALALPAGGCSYHPCAAAQMRDRRSRGNTRDMRSLLSEHLLPQLHGSVMLCLPNANCPPNANCTGGSPCSNTGTRRRTPTSWSRVPTATHAKGIARSC